MPPWMSCVLMRKRWGALKSTLKSSQDLLKPLGGPDAQRQDWGRANQILICDGESQTWRVALGQKELHAGVAALQ
jgi:hypothetical protein